MVTWLIEMVLTEFFFPFFLFPFLIFVLGGLYLCAGFEFEVSIFLFNIYL